MRLDKYLKVALIFKTRNGALKMIKDGKILLNDKVAKASHEVKVDDIIDITFPLKKVLFKILEIREKNVSKKEARELYEVVSETKFSI